MGIRLEQKYFLNTFVHGTFSSELGYVLARQIWLGKNNNRHMDYLTQTMGSVM